ncbi:MAG: ABC transporter substrate-binding protein [Chloroflexota bacterium]
MNGKTFRKSGVVLLGTLLVFGLIAAGVFSWLRSEPEPVTSCEADFRLFEHAFGVSCVPVDPQNVLSYGPTPGQFMAAIEHPVAMQEEASDVWTSADIPGLYEHLREVNEGVLDFGRLRGISGATSLELLLQIQPDLIMSQYLIDEDLARTASLVAPAVLLTDEGDWKETTLVAGDVIGELEEAEALIAAYDERVQILREQFDDSSAITVSLVALWPNSASILLEDSFSGRIIREVGFSIPEPQLELNTQGEIINARYMPFSEERLDLIDADFIFLFPSQTGFDLSDQGYTPKMLAEEFQSNPIFQLLEAAQSDTVYEAGVHWNVTGIYSAHYVLDDLFRFVAGIDPEEVAPNPLRLE